MATDVHSYQEELDQIVNEAKAVLARMDEVKHRFDAIAAKVDEVKHAFTDAKTTVDQKVAESSGHVETFFQHAHERLGQWESQVDQAYVQAANELVAKVTAAEALFTQHSAAVYQAVDKSRSVVQQVGDLIKNAEHEVSDGLRQGVHTLQDDVSNLKQSFDGTTHPSLATLDDQFSHTRDQAESFAHETHDHIADIQHQLDTHMHQDLFEPVQAHLGETAQKLAQIASGDVDAKVHDLMAQSREKLEQHAKQVISNLVDKVAHELDEVMAHIHQAGENSTLPREAMKPILDEIESLIKPVEQTIDSVKSVAAAVGFDV
jgi:chromosome segregation ATPase